MPIFEFRCVKCNKIYEKLINNNKHKVDFIPCPDCGETAFKIISCSNVIYKGSGFASKDLKANISNASSGSRSSNLSSSSSKKGSEGVGHYKETIKY